MEQMKRSPPTEKNDQLISLLKTSDTPVPWCDEFEKMISGLKWFSANAPEMLEHKLRITRLCGEFNKNDIPDGATLESMRDIRKGVLKRILGHTGSEVEFKVPFLCIFGCNITVGDRVFANHGLTIEDCAPVIIGSRVLFGPLVTIHTANHSTSVEARRSGLLFARPVSIGDDCWICGNVVILPGVKIGNGCTISAGSVVTHDIPPFCVARGNPAEVIRAVENPGDFQDSSRPQLCRVSIAEVQEENGFE